MLITTKPANKEKVVATMKSKDLLYPLRILKQIIFLPKTVNRQNSIMAKLDGLNKIAKKHGTEINNIIELAHTLDNRLVDIKHTVLSNNDKRNAAPIRSVNHTVSDDHSFDRFYKLFEDRFRGKENDIKKRMSEYTPLFDALPAGLKKKPVIDLGCGRGEFLSFAKDNGLNAIGIDINHDMVIRAKELGFTVFETDALSYVSNQKNSMAAAITGFHIVEHIPFGILLHIFEECYRILSPGGFVLFETPNPQNLSVGACNFYMDPSHIKPIPPELLAFALESVGFSTEIIPSHPAKKIIDNNDESIKDMMNMLYGPQDYTVFAKKF